MMTNQNQSSRRFNLRILTYNVFMRPPGIHNKGCDDHKNSRQKEISQKVVPNYDIICFQELFTKFNHRRQRILQEAFKNNICYASKPPENRLFSLALINSGLLNLSRYRISTTKFLEFKSSSSVDKLASKGVLYSKILIKETVVHLFNTHLQATYSHTLPSLDGKYPERKNIRARLNQVIEMRMFIQKTLEEESSSYNNLKNNKENAKFEDLVIICGDMNIKSDRELPKEFFTDLKDKKANDWIKSRNSDNFVECDFLKEVLSNYGKDHLIDFNLLTYGKHPETACGHIGSGNETPVSDEDLDEFIMSKDGGIDYIFQLMPFGVVRTKYRLSPLVEGKYCNINPFMVNHPKFGRMSDHFGVEAIMECNLQNCEDDL